MSSSPFRHKVVVVTGAAGGIGAAICRKFGREGEKIGLLDVDEKGVKAFAGELTEQGIDAFGLRCDVSREAECESAVQGMIKHFGGIDILVNNAGITQRSPFVDTELKVFRRVMDVNFFGSLQCTKFAMESLIKRKGIIVVIESIAGIAPLLGRSGYSASKHALHGLFTSLRSEIRPSGVHAMIVCPGFVKTNLQARALGGDGRVTTHPQSKVGREMSPESIAEAVYQGAKRRKDILILSPVGKLTYWLNRLVPGLYERLMARQLKEELIRE